MIQPTPSPCGRFIVTQLSDGHLYVLVINSPQTAKSLDVQLPNASTSKVCQDVQRACWASETQGFPDRSSLNVAMSNNDSAKLWLMLTSDFRAVVLELDYIAVRAGGTMTANVLADTEFPSSYGRITEATFTFSHDHILILFEFAPHATFIALARAQRDDIPNRKFATAQSYALSPHSEIDNHQKIALLTRDRHQDIVVVLEQGNLVASFKADTLDAQGIWWSPDGAPLLAICDSSAYGTKILFISAMGHPLRQFDVPTSAALRGPTMDHYGTGISSLDWISPGRNMTTLAFGDGSEQFVCRLQNSKSLSIQTHRYKHPTMLVHSLTALWQHLGSDTYNSIIGGCSSGAIGIGEVAIISISPDGQKVASKLQRAPKLVCIWNVGNNAPVAAILLQKEIRQLLWSDQSELAIVTVDSKASFHYWHDVYEEPILISPAKLQVYASSRWQGQWLKSAQRSATSQSAFMLSSRTHFDVLSFSRKEIHSRLAVSSILEEHDDQPGSSMLSLDSSGDCSRHVGDGTSIFF